MRTRLRYSELMEIPTFEERFEYLNLLGKVGAETFGYDRWQNQRFYRSAEWKRFRDDIIIRDNGCDLAIPDRQIFGRVHIHHLNPVSLDELANGSDSLLDPENVVCVSLLTHNAIHYGDTSILYKDPVVRRPNDTCPWKGGTL